MASSLKTTNSFEAIKPARALSFGNGSISCAARGTQFLVDQTQQAALQIRRSDADN